MPFIPHTEQDVAEMLAAIGASSIDALFDEIPAELLSGKLDQVPPALTELEMTRLMQDRAEQDGRYLNFLGAGAYEHHIPAAVWQIVGRGEFYTAYTPYQAEASQGTLQLLYEWQTMMASLTSMDVSNASLYDGGSGLGEALLMAVRASKSNCRRVLVPRNLHPCYRAAAAVVLKQQRIDLIEVPYEAATGRIDGEALERLGAEPFAALVISQPNFFGVLEEPDALTDWAHGKGALVIGICNPTALALLNPPGAWGSTGADIAAGEAQPLGIPLSGGGPYLGYMACKQALVRQMPGRIIGRTVDLDGKTGFALTLQAREQHIRRSKATSNICTNQGLMVTAATLYLALTGPQGLERIAGQCHANTRRLTQLASAIPGVAPLFAAPGFHEVALRLPQPVEPVLARLRQQRILGGFDLSAAYPELGHALLVCATETKTEDDLQRFTQLLDAALKG
jgi:glycine dehydrogenase subunit 1